MRFLIMTDIEGVTGITTYQQAENRICNIYTTSPLIINNSKF